MTTTSRPGRAPTRQRRSTWRYAAAAGAFAVLATAGCAGSDSATSAPKAADDKIGPATRTFHRSEVLSPATLAELGALSDVVVEARVTAIEHGPSMSDGEGLSYLVLSLEVTEGYEGAKPGETVKVLTVGYDPKDGAVYTGDGEHWPEPNTTGLWYLGYAEGKELSGYTYPRTSAGQILKTRDGLAETGGDQQAAAVLCRVSWDEAKDLVEKSVADSVDTKPLAVGEPSPSADPAFAGNPCAAHSHDEDNETQPTAPDKE